MPSPLRLARFVVLAAAACCCAAGAADLTPAQRTADFDAMWRAVDAGYAYFGRAREAWRRARIEDRPRATAARDPDAFVAVLEASLSRLHDDHATLSERSRQAPRRVPGETDIWPAWHGGRAVVESVRAFGDADVAGVRPGHEIASVDGVEVDRAVRERLGKGAPDEAARNWALRQALAGPRDGTLHLHVREGGGRRRLEVARTDAPPAAAAPVLARRIGEARDLGYVRIKGEVGETRTSAQLGAALDSLRDTRGLVVDLRDAQGDGGRAAIEGFLARFASAPVPWRLREVSGERQPDLVTPASNGTYRAPVVVLVDRWTAGDGEALAAGLAAVAGARLVGTRMAGLRGE